MNYCLGFIFNKGLDRVLLVKKNKGPANMAGRLNAIGGKVEKDEAGNEAMERECREETGLLISDWKSFCCFGDSTYKVYCYYSITDDIYNFKQIEDEELKIYDIQQGLSAKSIPNYYVRYPRMANLDWLIPMAINHYLVLDKTTYFDIIEH